MDVEQNILRDSVLYAIIWHIVHYLAGYFEGHELSNKISSNVGVFDRKLEGSHSTFNFYFDKYWRNETIMLNLKPIFHQNAKYLAWELALGNAPDARVLHWGYQHVGI